MEIPTPQKSDALETDPSIHSSPDPPERLTYVFPEKVWHSAPHANLRDEQREWASSWTKINPFYRQELLSTYSSDTFVRAHYSQTRPDIVEVYKALSIPILRAELLRYLVIFAQGGIWSDLDVVCEKPVRYWLPTAYQHRSIDMVVGLEFDLEWRGPGTDVATQFCSWVFMARPFSRNLGVVIDSVVNKLKDISYRTDIPIADFTLDTLPEEAVNITGPKIMTIALLDSLARLLRRPVDDRDFAGIKRPKLVGDILVLPGNSFVALQDGFPTDQEDSLVTHFYDGSWKQVYEEAKERKKQNQEQEHAA
ncbi:hypothetical protein BDV59DRAFT_202774 [Aspergillus ambiguus]|uniref:uncharacterized protein n=1 Tax=Aspergillus ambiguus TaxID=176160 RepID=UPI003CCD75F9